MKESILAQTLAHEFVSRFPMVASNFDIEKFTLEALAFLQLERLDQDWKSATRLAFTVSPTDPAELSVVQDGFHRLSLSECLTVWEHYRRRWRTAFDRLAEAIELAQVADD